LLDKLAGRGLQVVLEPGRRLVGNAGLLLTRVEYLKPGEGQEFRHHRRRHERPDAPGALRSLARHPAGRATRGETHEYDVVGPVCETGDFLGQARPLCMRNRATCWP
jgi:diaminopimelate decarboxylase